MLLVLKMMLATRKYPVASGSRDEIFRGRPEITTFGGDLSLGDTDVEGIQHWIELQMWLNLSLRSLPKLI